MFASDPALAQSINTLIEQGKTAERAVLEGFGAVEEMFKAIGGYQASVRRICTTSASASSPT